MGRFDEGRRRDEYDEEPPPRRRAAASVDEEPPPRRRATVEEEPARGGRRREVAEPGKRKFNYTRPTHESITRRKSQQQGGFDQPINTPAKAFSPKAGDHRVRILPATWSPAESYALDVYVHYGIGSDNNRYLCLNRDHVGHKADGGCPPCAEKQEAERAGEDKAAQELRASRRALVYLIDRDAPEDGVQYWAMPGKKMDAVIVSLSEDKRTREIFPVDDPEEGYDIEFTITGSKITTDYTNIRLARRPTPLSDDPREMDDWLRFAEEHPLPDCLTFFEADYIEQVLSGQRSKKDKEEEGDESPRTRHRDEEPPRRRVSADDIDEPPPARRRAPALDEDEDLDAPPARTRRDPNRGDVGEVDVAPRRRAAEDEDEPPRRRSAAPVDEDEEEPPPRRKVPQGRGSVDEEPPPRRPAPALDEDEDLDAPPPRRRAAEPDDEPPPRTRLRTR